MSVSMVYSNLILIHLHVVDPLTDKESHSFAMAQNKGMHHPLFTQHTFALRELLLHFIIVLNRTPFIRLSIIKHKLVGVLFDRFLVHDLDGFHFLACQEEAVLDNGTVEELLGCNLSHVGFLAGEKGDDGAKDGGSGKDEAECAHGASND